VRPGRTMPGSAERTCRTTPSKKELMTMTPRWLTDEEIEAEIVSRRRNSDYEPEFCEAMESLYRTGKITAKFGEDGEVLWIATKWRKEMH
jgi:hypothetical protein